MKPCVLIPCYNHSATVGAVAWAALAHSPVIVVDDGSTEALPELPRQLARRTAHLAVELGARHAHRLRVLLGCDL